jgi:hypothetical protein
VLYLEVLRLDSLVRFEKKRILTRVVCTSRVELSDLTAETEAKLGEVRGEDPSTIVFLDHSTTPFWAI